MTLWARNRDESPQAATRRLWHAVEQDRGSRREFHFYRLRCGRQLAGVMSSIDELNATRPEDGGICGECDSLVRVRPLEPAGRGDVVADPSRTLTEAWEALARDSQSGVRRICVYPTADSGLVVAEFLDAQEQTIAKVILDDGWDESSSARYGRESEALAAPRPGLFIARWIRPDNLVIEVTQTR